MKSYSEHLGPQSFLPSSLPTPPHPTPPPGKNIKIMIKVIPGHFVFIQLLWNLFTHCTVDIQKVTAISALCRLTCQSPATFQHVIEKAGFKAVLTALSSGVTKVQQAAVTMFITVLSTRPQARRLIQERELIARVMHLLESSSIIVRGKAFLMVLTMVQVSDTGVTRPLPGFLVGN